MLPVLNGLIAKLQNASAEIGKLAGRLPGPAGNIAQLLFTLLPRLQTDAQPLEDLIGSETRKSLLAAGQCQLGSAKFHCITWAGSVQCCQALSRLAARVIWRVMVS